MKKRTLGIIDFNKVDNLLEGFNKSTGFVTAILDLEGNVLSKSGWRQICTEFHRIHPETSNKCTISDTVLSGKMEAGEKYHFYKCLNGLVDVAVPIVIKGEHIANLFSGQFFFEAPDRSFFLKQAEQYGFNPENYLKALEKVPVVSKEKVLTVMDFLLNMTRLISDMTFQKLEQMELNEAIRKNERYNQMLFEQSAIGLALTSIDGTLIDINSTFASIIGRSVEDAKKLTYWDITPEKYKELEKKQLDLLEKTGRYGPYEKEYIHKDGHLVPVRLQGLIIERNQEKFIWSSVEDISEQKKAEQNILAANEKLSHTLERISDGFGSLDRNWIYTYVNEKLAQTVGKKREELLGRNIWEVFPEAVGTPVYKAYLRAMEEQVVIDLEHYYPPFERWFQHRFYPSANGVSVFSKEITDSKLAEAKNREKDQQFRKLSSNVPDLIFQFTRNPNGSYTVPVASEGIRNIFGCTPEEVANDFTPIGKVIHPDDAERVIADIEYSAKHLTHFTCEFRVQIPGRPVQWIFSRSTPEKLPDGSITWYGFNANITQRKEMEDALRESEGKFRKIYEEGPFGMALVNEAFTFTMVNRTFCEITGYTEAELQQLTFRDITFADDKEIGVESIKKLIKGEIPVVKIEKRYVRKDGEIIWAAVTVAANFDKNGKYLYNLSIIEDITGRKQNEEKIQTLNERLELLVEAIQELSIATSIERIMETVRTAARKLVNADGITFILREGDSCYYADEDSVSPLWKGQRFPLTQCISGWAILNKQTVTIPDIYTDNRVPIQAYKSTYVKSLAIAPIRLTNPLGAIGAYWGSHYIPSEMEIKLLCSLADAAAKAVENIQLIENLEQTISKRTAQLEAVNKELETFTYSVSHDLKAPLRGIDGYSKLLSDLHANNLNDEAKYFLSTIRKSTQLMSQLIDELLQYSRLERSQLRSEPVLIQSFVQAILKINEDEIVSRRISVTVDVPETPITADSSGMQMALRNLIENAIKFTKDVPEPAIRIRQEEREKSWVISVKDNGIGFDMKYSQRIFEIFQRLHRVEDYPGTGIGLAMVGKAMQRMNGKAWTESHPGQGATFFLEIPKPQH